MHSRALGRLAPATLAVTGALLLGPLSPAHAATVTPTTTTATTASVATTAATTASVATAATTTAPTLTAAQVAARAAAARLAAQNRVRARVVRLAKSKVGSRYVAGHAGPRRFDCSGLALYVYRNAAHRSLPHYSRAQYAHMKHVSRSHLRPGDLVFFFRHGAHHVGIYIGGGKMVSATNPRHGVKVDSVFSGWYGQRFSGAGRLF